MYHSGYGSSRNTGYGNSGYGGNMGYSQGFSHDPYQQYGNGYGNWNVAESFSDMKDVNWGNVQNFDAVFLEGSKLLHKIRPPTDFSVQPRNVKICEHSIFVNYRTKTCLMRH